MAIYHLAARVGSRSGGQSAAAAFAYLCHRGRFRSQPDQLLHAESHRLPAWAAYNPSLYWAAADRYERANGRLYQQVKVSLPVELTEQQQLTLARSFAAELATTPDGALPYTLVLHRGHGRNPHAHILISERIADGHDRSPATWFRRAASVRSGDPDQPGHPGHGGARKTAAFQPRSWIAEIRARWAEHANRALEEAGTTARIDHRSHAARGLAQLPTLHEGPGRSATNDRVARNAEIRAANLRLGEIRTHSATAQQQLDLLARQLGQQPSEAPPAVAAPSPLPESTASPLASDEVLRFIELHRRDFTTRPEALRWFERETGRRRTSPRLTTARALFDESLDELEPRRRHFSDALHTALTTPRWQEAPLSIAAQMQQARVEVATWTTTAAGLAQRLAVHRDPRSLWRRLLSTDPQRTALEQEHASALAQAALHRATLDRIEQRWRDEQPEWEQRADETNAARRDRQRQALDHLLALRPQVLAELDRRAQHPDRIPHHDPREAATIRNKLAAGVAPEELWLDMLLRKPYTLQQQEDLDRLIRTLHSDLQQERQSTAYGDERTPIPWPTYR